MTSHLDEFGKTAQRLARNPLGIIALFIVLVYGIAALLLGSAAKDLQPNERLPLVWFLVIFPSVVLLVFYRLVSNHHVKLYAPNDFPDKEGFFRVLSPSEQKKKLEEAVTAVENEEAQPDQAGEVSSGTTERKIINAVSTRYAYVLAEELAFRELENEFNTSVRRQIAVGRHQVDGIFIEGNRSVVVEVSFTRSGISHSLMKAKKDLEHFSSLASSLRPPPRFLLVIVSEGLTSAQRQSTSEKILSLSRDRDLPLEVRTYDLEELKKKYGLSVENTQQSHAPDAQKAARG